MARLILEILRYVVYFQLQYGMQCHVISNHTTTSCNTDHKYYKSLCWFDHKQPCCNDTQTYLWLWRWNMSSLAVTVSWNWSLNMISSTWKASKGQLWWAAMIGLWIVCVNAMAGINNNTKLIWPGVSIEIYMHHCTMMSWYESVFVISGPFGGNQLVYGRFPSQDARNLDLWCFFYLLAWTKCWINSQVFGNLRCHDVLMMSP